MRLGIDIGGTSTAAVLLADDGTVLARHARPSGYGPGPVVDVAAAVTDELCASAGTAPAALRGVGVGVPGTVDTARGRVRTAVNLGIDSLDLATALGRRLGVPVTVENDVNAAALGVHHVLPCPRPDSMAFVNLGTGLACGIVVGGQLWRGATGAAGEIGHVPVDPLGPVCACGQRGCLETLCSGSAIARRWPADEQPPPVALLAAVSAGDPAAVRVWEDVLRGAAATVRVVALTLDVDVVVLGGGVSRLGTPLLAGVRSALGEMGRTSPFLASLDLSARLRLAPVDEELGAVGAALLGSVARDGDSTDAACSISAQAHSNPIRSS